MTNKSHLTAIARNKLPGPTQWLIGRGIIQVYLACPKKILDYGCGKSHLVNNAYFPADGYDPHFRPVAPIRKYDIIICNYVLCVLPTEAERKEVLRCIQRSLKTDGVAYISVRSAVPKQGYGWSSRGTYQAEVYLNLELLHSSRDFRMYRLTKSDRI